MAKFNSSLLSHCCQPSVSGIEELVFFHVVLWIQPFLLELSPYGFRNIQMWRVWRKIRGVIIATDVNKDEPIIEYRYHSAAKAKTHLVRIKK